jgi:hypothetical protein
MSVVALLATIPRRRVAFEGLLKSLDVQTRRPDSLILMLDGYGSEEPPRLPEAFRNAVTVYSHNEYRGAGTRWRYVEDCAPEDIVVCVDDDVVLGPRFVEALVCSVEQKQGAAAAMGKILFDGTRAPPGDYALGPLVHGAGCGLAARAKDFFGVGAFHDNLPAISKDAPNFLGYCGDDDALVSAYLFKKGIPIHHAATGNILWAPNTQAPNERITRPDRVADPDAQKRWLRTYIGWPWTEDKLWGKRAG